MQPFDGAEPADARLLGIDGIGSEAAGERAGGRLAGSS